MSKDSYFDYNEVWHEWDDMTQVGPFHRHIHRIIKNLMRPLSFTSVCDVGCGSGSFLKELQSEFPWILPCGTDISETAIELAQAKLPHGHFWEIDITKQTIPQKFDLVLCCEVLEHIEEDKVALEHIVQMTGKYFIISTIQGKMRSWEATQVGHVRNYRQNELVHKMKEAGLIIDQVIEWGFPFYSPLYRDLLALLNGKGTKGKIGWSRRAISALLYGLFKLNSYQRGDEIIVLSHPASNK